MARPRANTPFAKWLEARLVERGLSLRGLARKMAHPDGRNAFEFAHEIERHRRNLIRYRYDGFVPTEPNRVLLAEALGVPKDEMPGDDEDEEAARQVTRDLALDLQRMFDAAVARGREQGRREACKDTLACRERVLADKRARRDALKAAKAPAK